jgi:RNA recognition motif-containing protein
MFTRLQSFRKLTQPSRLFASPISHPVDFRNFATKRIFVGNIPYAMGEEKLHEAFSVYGNIHSLHIPLDRETGRPRGFAFVEMDESDATKAINGLNGVLLFGREIRVTESRPREPFRGGAEGMRRSHTGAGGEEAEKDIGNSGFQSTPRRRREGGEDQN